MFDRLSHGQCVDRIELTPVLEGHRNRPCNYCLDLALGFESHRHMSCLDWIETIAAGIVAIAAGIVATAAGSVPTAAGIVPTAADTEPTD